MDRDGRNGQDIDFQKLTDPISTGDSLKLRQLAMWISVEGHGEVERDS